MDKMKYSVDEIISKSEKLTYLVNSLKAKKTNIVDIKAIEISHKVKNV